MLFLESSDGSLFQPPLEAEKQVQLVLDGRHDDDLQPGGVARPGICEKLIPQHDGIGPIGSQVMHGPQQGFFEGLAALGVSGNTQIFVKNIQSFLLVIRDKSNTDPCPGQTVDPRYQLFVGLGLLVRGEGIVHVRQNCLDTQGSQKFRGDLVVGFEHIVRLHQFFHVGIQAPFVFFPTILTYGGGLCKGFISTFLYLFCENKNQQIMNK